MSEHQTLLFLMQLAALLLVGSGMGQLARRVGLPGVVGELLSGVLLGPTVLGHLSPAGFAWMWPADPSQTQLLDAVSMFGVLLFIGVSSAHLDLRMLRRRPRTVISISTAALLLPLGLGIATGLLLPGRLLGPHADRSSFALLIGVVMGVSAIPVIAKTLTDLGMLHRDIGQLTLAAAAGGDVVAWILLSLVSTMTVSVLTAGHIAAGVGSLLLFLAVVIAARPLLRGALGRAEKAEGSGPVIAITVVAILAAAAGSQSLGLESALGAFAVGCLLSSPSRETAVRLAPLRTVTLSVFAPIFLAGAGLKMDLTVLGDPRTLAAAAVVLGLAVAGKFAGAYLGARFGRLTHWEGLALGAGLNARGAVEVVVATIGLRLGVISPAMYSIVVLVAVLTSMMAAPALRWTMAKVEHRSEEHLRAVELAAWSDRASVPTDPAQN
ncbi:cation:proton antiporter [Streptomyces sp. NPDC006259]|uniref:cation:proton antiporter n=1 Tax=Streptomyces sp. NPDC006259 TaxID=3364740 RepID=UPI0036B3BD3D